MGPILFSAVPTTGAWLATGFSGCAKPSVQFSVPVSRAVNRLDLLQVSILLKKAEE